MLNLEINEDKYTDADKRFHISFINFINGCGSWEYPIGNNSKVIGMTKEQSIELTKEILKTVQTYLEKEFTEKKNDINFIRCFKDI